MKKNELVAFASTYASFLLEGVNYIRGIILFGSVARGEADNQSDIDLFIDIDKAEPQKEKEIRRITEKFYQSKSYELWKQKGMLLSLSIKVGNLDQWKDLKRSIASEGIVLYGRYRSDIKLESYLLLSFQPIKNIARRNRIIRTLFGRNEANYAQKGLLREAGGNILSPTTFIVKSTNSGEIMEFLKKEKVDFRLFEIWSDAIR